MLSGDIDFSVGATIIDLTDTTTLTGGGYHNYITSKYVEFISAELVVSSTGPFASSNPHFCVDA